MNFEMVGKISLGKDSEKFHPYSETTYDSGWVKRKLMFNAICGDNRHLLSIDGGSFADEHGDVYTFTKGSVDTNGKRIKGESIKIPFKERLTSKKLAEVAEFKKFIIDLEKPKRRYKLEKALDSIKEGKTITDEELVDLGVESESEIKDALKKSKAKRHEFITEWDFAEFIKKVLDSGKFADKKFLIRGSGVYSYSDKNEKVYSTLLPQRIYLADDNAEEYSIATVKLLFGADALDEMSVEEKGRYFLNGYMMEYDNNRKANIPVPTTVTIMLPSHNADEKEHKKIKTLKRRLTVEDDSIREIGLDIEMVNGAQKTEITEDMLTDEQKEDLDCGLITMEDIISEFGGSIYGDRVQEYKFIKFAKGYSKGSEETAFTEEDMKIKPLENEEDDEDSIFDDDEL